MRQQNDSDDIRILAAIHLLRSGPFMLFHHCGAFSYGPPSSIRTPTTGFHAVVLTGIDTNRGVFYFNNPWGQSNVQTSIASISNAIRRYEVNTPEQMPPFAYLP